MGKYNKGDRLHVARQLKYICAKLIYLASNLHTGE